MSKTSSIKKRWATWVSIVLIIVGLGFGVKMLPSGYSEDLSVIGSGKNVVVLVHNKEGVRSLNLMNQVDAIRDNYNGRIEFRIAESGTPKGAEFVQRNMVGDAMLVLFQGDGTTVGKLIIRDSPEELAKTLEQTFGL